jgi:hypothetical protein
MILALEIAAAVAGVLLVGANALTTRQLWSSPAFEGSQKIAQTALIWLLPGSCLVVRHFLGEPHRGSNDDSTAGKGAFDAGDVIANYGHGDGQGGHH